MVGLKEIEQARSRIQDAIYVSPCPNSHALSSLVGSEVYLKLENLQMTGSFKERGAANKLFLLSPEERRIGVVASSAGNHAQALAYHARRLGISATIVMPQTSALIKVTSTREHGARVLLEGANYDEAYERAQELAAEEGLLFVHPFDDDAVIAGQGTLGLEILEQVPNMDAVVVCVGGGGLLAGVATAIKAKNPRVQVFGVEPEAAPSMSQALERGKPVRVSTRKTIADGAAVGLVSKRTLSVAQNSVDGLTVVDDETVAEAILLLLEREKTVAEGAGALGLAALIKDAFDLKGKRVVLIVSGGNIDVNMISRMIERGLTRSGRQMRVRVRLPDIPGALAGLLQVISQEGANVLQVQHDRVGARVLLGQAAVELALETRGFDHIRALEEAIRGGGFTLV